MTCPIHRILPALATVRMRGSPVQLSNLVVHPSPPRSMLEHTTPKMVRRTLKHAQSVCILRSDGPGLVSIEDNRTNQCTIYLSFHAGSKSSGSQQLVNPIVRTITEVLDRSNDRPEIAEHLYYRRLLSRRQLIRKCFPDDLSHFQAGTSSSSH